MRVDIGGFYEPLLQPESEAETRCSEDERKESLLSRLGNWLKPRPQDCQECDDSDNETCFLNRAAYSPV